MGTLNLLHTHTVSSKKPIKEEKGMYRHMEKNLSLMKIYMLQKKGIPDYIMISKNPFKNGFIECKCIDKEDGPIIEKHLTRPQQIILDIFISSGYKYYIAVCVKGSCLITIYEVRPDKEQV